VPYSLRAVSVAIACLLAAQTYRTSIRQVPVFATVQDQRGRLVIDLQREDFRVFDNGHQVPIDLFDPAARPLGVLLLLDTSRSVEGSLDALRDGADALLRRLAPRDGVRVGVFSDVLRLGPDFSRIDRRADPDLRTLAMESGGGYFDVGGRADFRDAAERIALELHAQYLLAFAPIEHDGRVHAIAVAARRSGVVVRARRSYVAPRSDGGSSPGPTGGWGKSVLR